MQLAIEGGLHLPGKASPAVQEFLCRVNWHSVLVIGPSLGRLLSFYLAVGGDAGGIWASTRLTNQG